ncbi:MAG: helix-turn-helix domain-containing protein [Nanoarchaeota archaeon]|nr:helix-turn-helix domain-containing protein [Nanoarchaeota archaeon]
MELETMFTEQKWNILKSLSSGKFSPLQLAERSNTTIANISQQLRLLEAAELVKKEKIPNRDKGKPRTLFSLSHDHTYLISTMKDFADKKLLELSNYHRILLRILFLEDSSLHYYISKFYWKIEDYLDQIKAIAVIPDGDEIKVAIVGDKAKEIEKKIGNVTIKKPNDKAKLVKVKSITKEELIKLLKQGKEFLSSREGVGIIYDPEDIITDLKKHVGGK